MNILDNLNALLFCVHTYGAPDPVGFSEPRTSLALERLKRCGSLNKVSGSGSYDTVVGNIVGNFCFCSLRCSEQPDRPSCSMSLDSMH